MPSRERLLPTAVLRLSGPKDFSGIKQGADLAPALCVPAERAGRGSVVVSHKFRAGRDLNPSQRLRPLVLISRLWLEGAGGSIERIAVGSLRGFLRFPALSLAMDLPRCKCGARLPRGSSGTVGAGG